MDNKTTRFQREPPDEHGTTTGEARNTNEEKQVRKKAGTSLRRKPPSLPPLLLLDPVSLFQIHHSGFLDEPRGLLYFDESFLSVRFQPFLALILAEGERIDFDERTSLSLRSEINSTNGKSKSPNVRIE